jgi:hypothetical protein
LATAARKTLGDGAAPLVEMIENAELHHRLP